MCDHDDTRLLERARDYDGRFTNEGEQFLWCRSCDVTFVAYPN
jgi:hypothetical protein